MTKLTIATSALLALAAANAHADVIASTKANQVSPEPAQSVPAKCRQFLTVPADCSSELLVWDQRLSLASCEIDTSAALPAVTTPESLPTLVASLDTSVRPSIAIYRDAMAHAPRQIQIIAAYHFGMTSQNLIVRARRALPADPTLQRALDPLVAGYAHDAAAAFAEIDRLAKESPSVASANEVVRYMVASARSNLR